MGWASGIHTIAGTIPSLTLILIIVRILSRPLREMTEVALDVAQGNYGAETQLSSNDELGVLASSFNTMSRKMSEDIARLKEINQVMIRTERLATAGALATSVAHEVNNPLGGLMNAVDTLETHGDEPAARHRVIDLLRRGLRGIQQVVRAALVTYKTEHHARHLTHADLQDLRFLIQHETGAKKLQLDWSNELPDVLEVDASPIRQIVLNLLLNACHVSPDGGTVTFRASLDGAAITLSVADEGPGLPLAAIEAIASGGSGELAPEASNLARGLGLWTAARLAKRLGGTLVGRSAPRGGALVELVIASNSDQGGFRAVA